jgi:hypothetical protein
MLTLLGLHAVSASESMAAAAAVPRQQLTFDYNWVRAVPVAVLAVV